MREMKQNKIEKEDYESKRLEHESNGVTPPRHTCFFNKLNPQQGSSEKQIKRIQKRKTYTMYI